MMKLHIIYDYKDIYPKLSGTELTDAMIRRCLGSEDIVIYRTEKGKPYVRMPEADCAGPYISVSHSGTTFALLVSDREVGLDIQYAREINGKRIAARYFTAEEVDQIASDNTNDRFFELWAQREACSKYTGIGLQQVMNREPLQRNEEVRFIDLRLEDGCFCSVCTGVQEGDQSDEIQISYGE